MAFYRNEAAGARMIRVAGRPSQLVDAGETVEIERHLVLSIPPGIVTVAEDGEPVEVAAIPADVAEMAEAMQSGATAAEEVVETPARALPEVSMALTKKQLLAIARREKVEVETDDNKAELVRKIEAARR